MSIFSKRGDKRNEKEKNKDSVLKKYKEEIDLSFFRKESSDLSVDELKELIDDAIEWEEKQKKVEDVAFPILGVVK